MPDLVYIITKSIVSFFPDRYNSDQIVAVVTYAPPNAANCVFEVFFLV